MRVPDRQAGSRGVTAALARLPPLPVVNVLPSPLAVGTPWYGTKRPFYLSISLPCPGPARDSASRNRCAVTVDVLTYSHVTYVLTE